MTVIRISRIRLAHIKNVSHGEVVLHNPRRSDGGSFLALYGQNGSGKTALIDALAVLKVVMSGDAVPDRCEALLEAGCTSAKLNFEFEIQNDMTSMDVFYEFELSLQQGEALRRIGIRREVLSVAETRDGNRARKTKVMDTEGGELAFLPEVHSGPLSGAEGTDSTERLRFPSWCGGSSSTNTADRSSSRNSFAPCWKKRKAHLC